MKKLLIFSTLIIYLSSCRSYQLNTVSSSDTHIDEITGIHTVENDSLIMSYSFSSEKDLLKIEIYNKLNEPLFVNWAQSALIFDEKAHGFVSNDITLDATTSNSQDFYSSLNNYNSTSGTISGNIKVSPKEGFIPPKSKISRKTSILNTIPIPKLDNSLYKPATFTNSEDTAPVKGKEAFFTEKDSPFKFKIYITLFTLKDNIPHLFAFQQNFFISYVAKFNANPKNLLEFEPHLANAIIRTKTTTYGKVMTGVAVVGALGVVGVADAAVEKNNGKQK